MSDSIENIRHSLAHLLAAAVLELYPDTKPAIGPAIETGFYYDFDFLKPITEEDLTKIEEKMKEILNTWDRFEKIEVSADKAKNYFPGNPYKLELIDELEKSGEKITMYKSGKFIDLCRGGHVKNTKEINSDAFKLISIAGAYWRPGEGSRRRREPSPGGSEKNPMLTRIYAAAFKDKKELDEKIKLQEEAEKRDHRKLGQQLDLFSFHSVSPGSVFWHPKGMTVWKELEKFIREKNNDYKYGEISTPIMVKKELYETSGHWQHYREFGFWFDVDKETYVLKPMNCPESTLIYSSKLRSYRDLPIRLSEPTGKLHRNEVSGALGGLFRVRQLTQDDAHIFLSPEQIEEEVATLIRYTEEVYKTLNFPISFKFATKPDNAMGDSKLWEKAEKALENVLKKSKISYETMPKDGAFYGPKIDAYAQDSLGREHQLTTIQLDFQMPERFKLEYIDTDGKPQRPVMIHRAILGSFERFIGVLTEHFGGAFPLWLAPVQIAVLPISEKHKETANDFYEKLSAEKIRTELDKSDETIAKKIREAELQKIPYIAVIGDKEIKSKTVSVRKRGKGDLGAINLEKFLEETKKEIQNKSL